MVGGIMALLKVFVIVIFISVMLSLIDENTTKSGSNGENTSPEKYVLSVCRNFIKKAAHNPSSVEFDRSYPEPSEITKNTYKITISLRAQNGFGAIRHFSADCIVRKDQESWSLISLTGV